MELRFPSVEDLITTPEAVGKLFVLFGIVFGSGLYLTRDPTFTAENSVWMFDLGLFIGVPLAFSYIGYRLIHTDIPQTKCKPVLLYTGYGSVAMFAIGNWILVTETLAENMLSRPGFLMLTLVSIGGVTGASIALTHSKDQHGSIPPTQPSAHSENTAAASPLQQTVSSEYEETTKQEHMAELDEFSRRIIHLLEDSANNTMSIDNVIDELATILDSEGASCEKHRKNISTTIRHTKIPILTDRGLVSYNPHNNTLTYHPPNE